MRTGNGACWFCDSLGFLGVLVFPISGLFRIKVVRAGHLMLNSETFAPTLCVLLFFSTIFQHFDHHLRTGPMCELCVMELWEESAY